MSNLVSNLHSTTSTITSLNNVNVSSGVLLKSSLVTTQLVGLQQGKFLRKTVTRLHHFLITRL